MKQQTLDFSGYPNSPGYKRTKTSRAAARAIKDKAPTLRERAMEVLRAYSSTSDEIARALGVSILALRPRISELVELGMVEESGNYRENDSGKLACVWRVKTSGRRDKM